MTASGARRDPPNWGVEPLGLERAKPARGKDKKEPWMLKWMKDVAPVAIHWLWYPYIPLGRITIFEGDPGIGKSFITCSLAAAVSNGSPLPGQDHIPKGRVLMLSGEDGIADTVRPRLDACGANVENIAVPAERVTLDENGCKRLDATIRAAKAKLVVIDPVSLYIGAKKDMNKANEVRDFMDMLYRTAEATNTAIVLVRHLRKGGAGEKAIYKGVGSIDFVAAVRSVVQVSRGEDETGYFSHEKCNIAPLGATQMYKITDERVEWVGTIPRFQAAHGPTVTAKPKRTEACIAFLKDLLRAGPVLASEAEARARDEGFTPAAVKRARKGLVDSVKRSDGLWEWQLVRGYDKVECE